jgi:aspartate/methionine/tyrosine aminotransferase
MDFAIKIAKRTKKIAYAIRDIDVPSSSGDPEIRSKKLLKLNIGDPLLFDFTLPAAMRRAMSEAVNNGHNNYADSQGLLELRQAIVKQTRAKGAADASEDEVVITSGTSEAVSMLFACMLDPEDEVLLPSPAYPQYEATARLFEGIPKYYRCVESQGWQPSVDDLRKKISRQTRAIVVINPNNPTGAVYSRKVLKEILDVAGEHAIPVISDEIYDSMVFDAKHASCASLSKDVPVITLNGMSKNYLAPGWRLGWMMFSNFLGDSLKEAVLKLCRLRLCANAPAQYAFATVLKERNGNGHVREMVRKLKQRRDFTFKRLNEISANGCVMSCTKPGGAFYAFPKIEDERGIWKDDKDFVLRLKQQKRVLFVYGSGFGHFASDPRTKHFRVVYLPPLDVLGDAFDRLEEFVKEEAKARR